MSTRSARQQRRSRPKDAFWDRRSLDANGNPVQEHVYLGDRPVAVVQGGASGMVGYVSTDQLNTPRLVTDQSQAVLWAWNSDPFGNGNPTGSLTYNLRFPGQYYDAETGHSYNMNRDYDPGTGRYIESDPIGLGGGVNTYAYALESPLRFSDLFGQNVTMTCRSLDLTAKIGIYGIKHCSVFVWHWENCPPPAHKKIDAQYSLAMGNTSPTTNPNSPSAAANRTFNEDTAAFNNPGGGAGNSNQNIDIAPPSGMSQGAFDSAVETSGNDYSQGPYNPIYGPNSNTAANNIISNAGGSVPAVPGAVGQYPVPPEDVGIGP